MFPELGLPQVLHQFAVGWLVEEVGQVLVLTGFVVRQSAVVCEKVEVLATGVTTLLWR